MSSDLAEIGVTDGLLLPDNLLSFAAITNFEYTTAVMRAYNRWLAAEWLEEGNGLWGAVMAIPQNPIASAEEIRAYADTPGMKAVYLPDGGRRSAVGLAASTEPIMEAAAECNMPLVLHSVSLVSPAFPHNTQQFENHFRSPGADPPVLDDGELSSG